MEIITNQRFRKTVKYLRALLILGMIGLGIGLFLFIGVLIYAKLQGPPPLAVPQSTIYYSDDGTVIGESNNGQKRYWVPIDEIAPSLVEATISIEDKSFYDHHGFDYKRIAGAAIADIKAMAKVQGASTITQQYARNLFLEHDKTWKRKLYEAIYSIRLEMNYSKQEILEGYLNTIYYGNGMYGVQAASQFYFGKDAKDLTLAEATVLAGIPKGPGIYSPFASMEKSKQRQKIILASMVTNGYISKIDADTAYDEPFMLIGKNKEDKPRVAPYFQDAVRSALKTQLQLDDRIIELGGLKVYTTLNLKQQAAAEKKVEQFISKDSDIQIGLIAMDPQTGEVKALVGGRNYDESPFNRSIQAVRQPGSTFKPFLYYAALEQGFTPATTMRSEETTFRFDDQRPPYTPHNFNNQYADGDITMAQALALSDNVYAVKTHLFIGMDALKKTAERVGIQSKLTEVPSLALGTSGVRVIEMANAYSMFANGGKKVSPNMVTRVENHKGEIIYELKPAAEQVLQPDLAYISSQMMTGMFDRNLNGYASVTGSTVINEMTRTYAGKSGSTDSDSWMVGYTPQLVTAVWTGYDKGNPLTKTVEKAYAKNVWVHFMEEALKDEPAKKFKKPKTVIGVYIDPTNGKLATKDCPIKVKMYFREGTEPTDYCADHIEEEQIDEPLEQEQQKEKQEKKSWYKRIFDWAS
ncbi:PBP1A family penicillin-binding protein [Cytobacillus spongiae]|jgi:1A family penicillin-binding protein|uniref:transglycosylase domain-containing protein n=1 Tax=Cytobacillus spongiae TaxID=2901381 RepID=UPI001F1D9A9F|nr:PBP1A family penicillin-binding protein [Cytobacillus spongiae]UII55786.1 PBP1A family penicillin-binding protein [Cytobacillus spongiae]